MHIMLGILPAKKICTFLTTQVNTIAIDMKCSENTLIKPMHSLDPTFFTTHHVFVEMCKFPLETRGYTAQAFRYGRIAVDWSLFI